MREPKYVTVVIGQRGGGQVLGVFTEEAKIKALKQITEEFQQKGYVVFEKVKVNDYQFQKFGLYFK